jgi:hypothetical protein
MMIATPTLPLAYLDVDPSVRWFCRHGCVVHRDDLVEMFVGGSLIGSFAPRDTGVRNALVVGLAEDPAVHLGRLAKAFGLTSEGLRPGRRQHESHGLAAVVARKRGGGVTKLTAAVRRKLERRFEKGESVQSILAHERRVAHRTTAARAGRQDGPGGSDRAGAAGGRGARRSPLHRHARSERGAGGGERRRCRHRVPERTRSPNPFHPERVERSPVANLCAIGPACHSGTQTQD